MAKIKKKKVDCPYVIYPVGTGLPLCTEAAAKDHRLHEARLQDFSICHSIGCPNRKNERQI